MTASMTEFASANQGFSLISNRKLLTLYAAMVACRRIAENSASRLNGKRGSATAASVLGHEAAAVGAAIDLHAHDTIAPALWPEDALKTINPTAGVAPGFSLAARKALAGKDGGKIWLYFSPGKRRAQTSWLKALAVAAEDNLPILFVFLNRPETSAMPGVDGAIPLKRKGYALPVINVDSNDVVAVYRVASEAIAHARKGHGPTLIDCRLSIPADPLKNMQKYLIGKGLDPGEFAVRGSLLRS